MMFKTHIAAGFLAGTLLIPILSPHNQILFIILVMFGAALPDVDHPRSKLGSRVKIIAALFEHRGFFHSFLMLPVIAGILWYFGQQAFSLPLIIGYSSHLLSDAVTKEGIMVLHPISRARIRGFIRTGGSIEYGILILLFIADIILLLRL